MATNETPIKTSEKSAIKHIGCEKDLREKGEPIAWFTIDIPKEVKNLNKCINEKKHKYSMPQLNTICVVPENGKLYATNTHILQSVRVTCSGEWPAGEDKEVGGTIYYRPFQCNIDPKAINHLAGKTVDVAVWQDGNGNLDVTACEAPGVLTQYDETRRGGRCFPDAERILRQERELTIRIARDSLKPMRDWVKEHMGKATPDSSGSWDGSNRVILHAIPYADTVRLAIKRRNDNYEWEDVAVADFDLDGKADSEVQLRFYAPLFHLSVDGDFNGEICMTDHCHPVSFMGECRTSVLMPLHMEE